MPATVLLLGSNMGNRLQHFALAEEAIEKQCGTILQKSPVYETAPWGFEKQADFLNKVILVETPLNPLQLLHTVKLIEQQTGRIKNEKWRERVIDIDILFYDDLVLGSDELTIPHPYLHERRFTLVPLNELIPQYVHPVLNTDVQTLLKNCKDKGSVKKLAEDFFKQ